jgi:hypothetical protein
LFFSVGEIQRQLGTGVKLGQEKNRSPWMSKKKTMDVTALRSSRMITPGNCQYYVGCYLSMVLNIMMVLSILPYEPASPSGKEKLSLFKSATKYFRQIIVFTTPQRVKFTKHH